jgi:hypothetical protein
MAQKYCKICGAEWEENFDECWNCGMPADPDEQLWFDKDAQRRLKRKKRKKHLRTISRLNRGIYIPLILGSAVTLKIIAQGGFKAASLTWDLIGLLMFAVSMVYIARVKLFR